MFLEQRAFRRCSVALAQLRAVPVMRCIGERRENSRALPLPLADELLDRVAAEERLPDVQQNDLLAIAAKLLDDHAPAAQTSDILVGARAVDQFEHRRRAPVEHREEEPEAERIRVGADRLAETPRDRLRNPAEGHRAAICRFPDARVDVGRERAVRIMKILRQPALSGRVFAGHDAGDRRKPPLFELIEAVRRPGDDLTNDADDECRCRDHQSRIRREVDCDLDPVSARSHSDAGRAAIASREGDGHRKQVGEQQRQAPDVAIASLLPPGNLERDVVVTAVCLETDMMSRPAFPLRERVPDEFDLLPEISHHAGSTAFGDLDHRRHDLDHTAIEVHSPSGRKLGRGFLAAEHRLFDEGARMLPVRLRIDLDPVEIDVEFRLHADCGHAESLPRPAAGVTSRRLFRQWHLGGDRVANPARFRGKFGTRIRGFAHPAGREKSTCHPFLESAAPGYERMALVEPP